LKAKLGPGERIDDPMTLRALRLGRGVAIDDVQPERLDQ
jgi:hypothetical protein